jgi:CRP-like cAMP-binding protein
MSVPGIAAATSALRSRFLEGLGPHDLQIVLGAANQLQFRANSVVAHQGDPADHFFVLMHGRARYFSVTEEGKKLSLFWLTPGEPFGGAAFLSRPSLYLISTETVKDSCVLSWDRNTIRGLVARYPVLLENALLIAYDYFDWYVATHIALSCHTARQRLCQILISAAQIIGQKVPEGVEIDVTNEELASAANVTPFTVSRALSEWQRNHVVKKLRGKVLLRSPERLLPRII